MPSVIIYQIILCLVLSCLAGILIGWTAAKWRESNGEEVSRRDAEPAEKGEK